MNIGSGLAWVEQSDNAWSRVKDILLRFTCQNLSRSESAEGVCTKSKPWPR